MTVVTIPWQGVSAIEGISFPEFLPKGNYVLLPQGTGQINNTKLKFRACLIGAQFQGMVFRAATATLFTQKEDELKCKMNPPPMSYTKRFFLALDITVTHMQI